MKKFIIAITLLVVFLIVFIPLASNNPDGLEKTVQTYGAEDKGNIWKGLLGDYTISAIGNPYLSTLIAGVFGTVMVLVVGLVIGKLVLRKHSRTLG